MPPLDPVPVRPNLAELQRELLAAMAHQGPLRQTVIRRAAAQLLRASHAQLHAELNRSPIYLLTVHCEERTAAAMRGLGDAWTVLESEGEFASPTGVAEILDAGGDIAVFMLPPGVRKRWPDHWRVALDVLFTSLHESLCAAGGYPLGDQCAPPFDAALFEAMDAAGGPHVR